MLCVVVAAESALLWAPFHISAPAGITELPPVDNLQKIEESHVSVLRKASDLRIDYALHSMKLLGARSGPPAQLIPFL
jgi:hypothetical protein